jgi:hypothetical protein
MWCLMWCLNVVSQCGVGSAAPSTLAIPMPPLKPRQNGTLTWHAPCSCKINATCKSCAINALHACAKLVSTCYACKVRARPWHGCCMGCAHAPPGPHPVPRRVPSPEDPAPRPTILLTCHPPNCSNLSTYSVHPTPPCAPLPPPYPTYRALWCTRYAFRNPGPQWVRSYLDWVLSTQGIRESSIG